YGGPVIDTSTDFCLKLLEEKQVALVMGSAFGAEGYVRLSYASAMDVIEAGFDRFEAFLKSGE
ncbi:MAG: aspartate aminotransferase, partial [Planctomycetales bacterium]